MSTPSVRAALLALAGLPLIAFAQSNPNNHAASPADVAPADAAAAVPAPAQSVAADASTANGGALEPIVVTAQRGPQPLAEAIPQTTRFSRQDIADSTATDLPGLLAQAPGAQIIRNGPPGSNATLFLRGGSATQSLVLIDGVRVDSVSLGQAQIGQIPLSDVDHVEIVNGDVSALYGSGAMGGVVQVFTKDGGNHPPRFNFSVGYGSYHTQTQQAGVNGALDKDGKTTFSFSVSRSKDDGFSAIDPALAPSANPGADGYLNETVSAMVRHKFDEHWDAGVRYFQSNGKDSFDSAFGAPTDVNYLYSKVREASVFANGKLTDWWTTHLTAALGDDRAVDKTNGVYNERFDTDNRQFTWQNDFKLAAQQKLQLGYERLDQSLDSDQFAAPDRHVNSVFAGYTARFGASQIQANVRRDQYSDFGGANTYYLGYGFDFTEHWKATASYSSAFRAPSFDDLYFPGSGNPSIRPERSHSVEAALQYASDELGVLRLTAFQTRYSDLINYVPTQGGLFYIAENVGRAKVQGLEGSWSGSVGKTRVRAAFTLQNPVDEDAGVDLPRRARHFASFSANRSFGGWRVGGEWIVSGVRNDSGVNLAGFGLVNLSARYDITKAWYVSAHIDNLFDKNYELAYTYNTPRRSAFITIGWQQQ
ncbi:TonB-dependent receptor plug domain-containing protein [Trinickia soli]|uniref:TonB-dependent receptor n=1 Tax=Trinickia soli TaxID=380675 RepID=A0A2N7W0L7_9BURK|nr:TonB-dependent receptor [Trinickia soli]KAA0090142.1 TonB-dependent receptor [Paraburkholderia sp. T12-10]PMS22942.1 TonB-dependent receptor [Trinickia soli]